MNYELECWGNWLLQTRLRGPHGRDTLDFLTAIRDRVLDRAQLLPGDYVLDVGSGDGLLAFGALHRVGISGLVVVDDISQEELEACTRIAAEAQVSHRMRFIRNSAVDLADVPDASVDAVLMRSVLMYVHDRRAAAAEFRRVLRPGGRLSLFEPINKIAYDRPRFGIDAAPIADLASRVEAACRAGQSAAADATADFDERDLLNMFDAAGFSRLDLELHVKCRCERKDPQWFDLLLDSPGHGHFPSLRRAIESVLAPEEVARYVEYYRSAVATAGVATRQGFVYLSGGI